MQTKLSLKKIHEPLYSLQHYSHSHDMETTLNVHRQMNELRSCEIYINFILLSHKKEQNNVIFSNMDGIRGSHTK